MPKTARSKKKSYGRKAPAAPLRLDLGCGTRKLEGFIGVDVYDFPGVDEVVDLREPWPWKDGSVAEVHASHMVEHLTNPERVHFFNELHRVLQDKGTAKIITPHWSNACAYGDPTHQWPPVSEWMAFYLDKGWRAVNAPHVDYTCDFEFTCGVGFDERALPWNDERRLVGATHSVNVARDFHLNLTKR